MLVLLLSMLWVSGILTCVLKCDGIGSVFCTTTGGVGGGGADEGIHKALPRALSCVEISRYITHSHACGSTDKQFEEP